MEVDDNKNGNWNAQMSSRFQVMRNHHSIGYTDWTSAYNACKQYNKEGGSAGQWRLPTQRELMMIWILHPQLLGKGGYQYVSQFSWSVSASDKTAWIVSFSDGGVYRVSKTENHSVRCVRDMV